MEAESDPRFALEEETSGRSSSGSGLLGVAAAAHDDEGDSDDGDTELNRQPSQLSRLEDEIERLHAQKDSLAEQIEAILEIKARQEDLGTPEPDLRHEGKRAGTDPLLLRVRTGQLAVIGGYCADLRERCDVLTDAQGEMKERLRAARLREMALSTELESVAISNMHNIHGNVEPEPEPEPGESSETVESLRAEVARLREELAAKPADDRAQAAEPEVASLKQAVASLQQELEAAQAETQASRLRERTMSQDIATLMTQQSATSTAAEPAALEEAGDASADVQAQVDETVKKVLSEAFDQMREIFVASGSFSGDHILAAIKGVIRGVLQSTAPQLNTPTPRAE